MLWRLTWALGPVFQYVDKWSSLCQSLSQEQEASTSRSVWRRRGWFSPWERTAERQGWRMLAISRDSSFPHLSYFQSTTITSQSELQGEFSEDTAATHSQSYPEPYTFWRLADAPPIVIFYSINIRMSPRLPKISSWQASSLSGCRFCSSDLCFLTLCG